MPGRSSRCKSAARGHLSRRAISAAGVGLRGRGQPAHRRGGVRGAGRRPAPTASPRRRPAPAAISPSAGMIPATTATTSCTRSPAAAMAAMPTTTGWPTAARPSASPRRTPIEIIEQRYPVLYRAICAARGLGRGRGAARRLRGRIRDRLRRGAARASFVMDHGRIGPQGALGGDDGAPNDVGSAAAACVMCRRICRRSRTFR